MFQEIMINAVGGFIGGVGLMALTGSGRAPQDERAMGTSAIYHDSIHIGDNVTQVRRVVVQPTIERQVQALHREAATASATTAAADEDAKVWVTGAIALGLVALYGTHQEEVLQWMVRGWIAVSAFLLGCLAYPVMSRVRFARPIWFQGAGVLVATGAVWFVPGLARNTPWGGEARAAIGLIRRSGIWAALRADPSFVLFVGLQLLGLVVAVMSQVGALRFALALLAQSRLASRLDRGRRAPMARWALNRLGGLTGSVRLCVASAVCSLLLTSGAAFAAGGWFNTTINDAVLRLQATGTLDKGQAKLCLATSGRLTPSPEAEFTLQRRRGGGRWTSVRKVSADTHGRRCAVVPITGPSEYRWTDDFGQRHSNVVRLG